MKQVCEHVKHRWKMQKATSGIALAWTRTRKPFEISRRQDQNDFVLAKALSACMHAGYVNPQETHVNP